MRTITGTILRLFKARGWIAYIIYRLVLKLVIQLLTIMGDHHLPSGSQSQNLLLDSGIRDWVVLPLLVMLIAAGLLRHYVSIILRPSNVKNIPVVEHRVKSVLLRASRLRSGGAGFLSKSKWEARKCYWTDDQKGYLKEELEWVEEEEEVKENDSKERGTDDVPDPMAMMGPMKGQFVFMAQNMIIMQGISYLFQGFVLVKVPFPLTNGFKMMFQKGLDLGTLDTSYVSSVSWYFLVMFGLRAFFRLAIGDSGGGGQEGQESSILQSDFGVTVGGGPPGQTFNAAGAMKNETENLELMRYRPSVDDAEKRLLGNKYPKKKVTTSSTSKAGDDLFGFNNLPSGKGKKVGRKQKSS